MTLYVRPPDVIRDTCSMEKPNAICDLAESRLVEMLLPAQASDWSVDRLVENWLVVLGVAFGDRMRDNGQDYVRHATHNRLITAPQVRG